MLPFKKKSPGLMVAVIGGKGTDKDAYKDDAKPKESESLPGKKHDDALASKLRKRAALDIGRALGADPKSFDAEALDLALVAHYEACHGSEEETAEPSEEEDSDE